jgi:large subunit ribosomal protein L18
LPRLVVRKTNNQIIVQVIRSRLGGDETILTITSRKLRDYGWRASLKNTPAAYLTGLLAWAPSKGQDREGDLGYRAADA